MMPGGAKENFEVLFVCLGNLCRSPMAEGIARDLLVREYPESAGVITVSSAGLGAPDGEPATEEAVLALAGRGIDISAHRARRVTPSVLAAAGLVLAMEDRHRERLMLMGVASTVFVLSRLGEAAGEALKERDDIRAAPTLEARLGRLTRLADRIEREGLWSMPDHEYDVPDPIGLTLGGYQDVVRRMDRPIEDIFRALLGGQLPAAG